MATSVKRSYSPEKLLEIRARVDGYMFQADARRLAATRKLINFRFLCGDLHTHSLYSDGLGSVAQNWDVGRQRGLDFMFATDHQTIRQKVECRKFKGVWWGQEPGAGHHHIAILDNRRKYTPLKDLKVDAERLRSLSPFFFFPHPTGWVPACRYEQERMDALEDVGPDFAMEVMNGIFRTAPFREEWERGAVALWDKLLTLGRRVTGLGASDAHMPATVGNVWTGIIGARLRKESVLKGLREGRVFASSGPAINVRAAGKPMGGEVRVKGGRLAVQLECADSYGLGWARVIVDGREAKRFEYGGSPYAREEVSLRMPKSSRYLRVECAANDDRRAYANPIYVAR